MLLRSVTAAFLIILSLQLNAQVAFTDVAQSSGINFVAVFSDDVFTAQGGVAWFDYDKDGFEDLYLAGGANADALFRNNGDGTFAEVTALAGLDLLDGSINTMGVVTGDIDNDGFREIFVTTEDSDLNHLFYNNGDGTFTDISVSAGVHAPGNSASATFGDINKDGFLDLYVTNWCVEMFHMETHDTFPSMQNYLYLNNGDLTFEEVSADYGVADPEGCGLAATFTDYDGDGDVDLLLGNDFGPLPGNSNNKLFRNEYPINSFTDVSVATGMDMEMFSMGIAIGDYNEDGQLDYYITNEATDALLTRTDSTYTNQTMIAGVEYTAVPCLDGVTLWASYGWGCGFADFDLDSHIDLFVVNGDLHWGYPRPCLNESKLFMNQGNSTFQDYSYSAGVSDPYMSRGGAFCDFDNDGDIDILLGTTDSVGGNANVKLFRNEQQEGNWLTLNLQGTQGNRDAYGTRVEVVVDGRKLIRECDGGSSFNSHHSSRIHFGLGEASEVDTLRIRWMSGTVDEFHHVLPNAPYSITEGLGIVTSIDQNRGVKTVQMELFPNPTATGSIGYSISGRVPTSYTISLLDLTGKFVQETRYEQPISHSKKGSLMLPENISNGIYLVLLQAEKITVPVRLSVVK